MKSTHMQQASKRPAPSVARTSSPKASPAPTTRAAGLRKSTARISSAELPSLYDYRSTLSPDDEGTGYKDWRTNE
jgi:hypothetical protein